MCIACADIIVANHNIDFSDIITLRGTLYYGESYTGHVAANQINYEGCLAVRRDLHGLSKLTALRIVRLFVFVFFVFFFCFFFVLL